MVVLEPAHPTPREKQRRIIGRSDERILMALQRYHLMTAAQLARLEFRLSILTWVQTRLKRLHEHGYVSRFPALRFERFGSSPYVYELDTKGFEYAAELGLDVPQRHRRSEGPERYPFLPHTLAVNEALIALELLCRGNPAYELVQLLHERTLNRRPTPVRLADGSTIRVKPDGWFMLHVHDATGYDELAVALELDRNTEVSGDWMDKVEGLLAWAAGPYRAAFNAETLLIAVATTGGPRRLANLRRWTGQVLKANSQERQEHLFRFTDKLPPAISPETFYCSPIWYRPSAVRPVPLLEVDTSG